MPLAIIAGLAFLALEVAALAWLFHWLFAGTVGYVVIAVVIVLAMTATLIAWASVGVANHADSELDRYMTEDEVPSATRGESTKSAAAARKKAQRSGSGLSSDAAAGSPNGAALDLSRRKATGNFWL